MRKTILVSLVVPSVQLWNLAAACGGRLWENGWKNEGRAT